MNIFLLGAGRPARGRIPSALKQIAMNTRAMDWQIHSFKSITSLDNIHYLGGYHVDEVIKNYPQLNFTVIPNWQSGSALHTLLAVPFTDSPAITSYSDTVFRDKVIEEIISIESDVVFAIDSQWKKRFDQRNEDDINSAETIEIFDASGNSSIVEFTGLISFGEKAAKLIKGLDESNIGSTLVHLIEHLESLGFSIKPFDVAGNWAELNSPKDIAKFILGTKADTLARLEPVVKKSHIGKQLSFTTSE